MLGRVVKIAPGRYKVVFPKSGPQGGRPSGIQAPIPKDKQEEGKKYCGQCDRRLNVNNRSGLCRRCAPHGRSIHKKEIN